MTKTLEYTHLPTGEDILCVAGYYTPVKEARLQYNGREILYVVGQAVLESSCCGKGQWEYALVPGYVLSWQSRTNHSGRPVSLVEPVGDRVVQEDLTRTIQEAESVSRVEFW